MNLISKTSTTEEDQPIIVSAKTYPDSYEGDWQPRKLKNGSWALWSDKLRKARDMNAISHSWPISHRFFRSDCQGTRSEIHEIYLKIRYDKNPFEDEQP